MRDILALIPARGGSKGIPRKNVLEIEGLPLIAYSINQAKQSKLITRVIVSTDDREIADVSKRHGADVPFLRPAELAGDLSPDVDTFRHALEWLQKNEGYRPELVVHLRPTGPLRKVSLIDQAIDLMLQHPEADALRSVSMPMQTPYKMWRIENGLLKPIIEAPGIKESFSMPRQLLPPVYWQNGYVDVVRPRTVLEWGGMCGKTVLPFIVNEPIHELDYPDDIPGLAEAIRREKAGESSAAVSQNRLPV